MFRFYRKSVERGKCFIEYMPAENAWVSINAEGSMYIDACGWLRLKDMDMQMIYLMPVSLTAREKSGTLFFGC